MRKAPRIVIAACASGSGKTWITCGILAAFSRRGLAAASFKCGPDYIDPLFHETVLGVPSKNLDTFFAGKEETRQLFLEDAPEEGISVIEGVMGYYDGIGGTSVEAGTYDLACTLKAPVILVVDASGQSLSVCAQIKGFLEFRKPSGICGVILNRISPMLYERMKKEIIRETGTEVLGYLPKMPDLAWESRHLGLVLPAEKEGIREDLGILGDACEKTLDLDGILRIAGQAEKLEERPVDITRAVQGEGPRIYVAKDEAFCFYYKDNLRLLEKLGARLEYFSPLHDRSLPETAGGLYLGGGYPELFADRLEENREMRDSIKSALDCGMPCIAECGGFLYLLEELRTPGGECRNMTGFLPGSSYYAGKLGRFGYVTILPDRHSICGWSRGGVRGHEFHYMDTEEQGEAFLAEKPSGTRSWRCGQGGDRLYAGFPHLYFYSARELAEGFVRKAQQYERRKMFGEQ